MSSAISRPFIHISAVRRFVLIVALALVVGFSNLYAARGPPAVSQEEKIPAAMTQYFDSLNELSVYDEAFDYAGLSNQLVEGEYWPWEVTNEPAYYTAVNYIENIGGTYIGVGAGWQNLAYVAAMKASSAYILDVDTFPIEVVHPLRGALIMKAENRLELLSWIFSKQLSNVPDEETISAMSVADLKAFLENSGTFDISVREEVWEEIAGLYPEEKRQPIKGYWMDPNVYASGKELFTDVFWRRMDNPGSFFESEENLRIAKELWLNGRFRGAVGDFAREGLKNIIQNILNSDEMVGAFYVSNVPEFFTAYGMYCFLDTLYETPKKTDGMFITSTYIYFDEGIDTQQAYVYPLEAYTSNLRAINRDDLKESKRKQKVYVSFDEDGKLNEHKILHAIFGEQFALSRRIFLLLVAFLIIYFFNLFGIRNKFDEADLRLKCFLSKLRRGERKNTDKTKDVEEDTAELRMAVVPLKRVSWKIFILASLFNGSIALFAGYRYIMDQGMHKIQPLPFELHNAILDNAVLMNINNFLA